MPMQRVIEPTASAGQNRRHSTYEAHRKHLREYDKVLVQSAPLD